ncbi:hypothetical protein MC885_021582 [Smutsia gigantea]|nr:hypothetical protein MC885_021582 [Smutsia gigantea]
MRLRSPQLLLLLLVGLRADAQGKEVRAMVGSDVELSCIYPKKNSFDLNDLYVYWQINVTEQLHAGRPHTARPNTTVVTYYLARNGSSGHKDSRYKDRAHLSPDRMKRGDFSLHLHNITPQDEQKFNCLVFRESLELEMILKVVVTLHVAANYSMPVVSALSSPEQDEALTFMCTSTNGYPKPNVYWINKTDNSLLDTALQNSTISLNGRGLYDVVSVLRVRRTPNVNVGCCIENVLLHQNLTVSSQAGEVTWGCGRRGAGIARHAGSDTLEEMETHWESKAFSPSAFRLKDGSQTVSGTKDSMTESQANAHEKNRAVLSVLALLGVAVAVAVAVGWVYRSRCPRSSQAGARWTGQSRNSLTMLDKNSLPSTWTELL